MKKLVFFSALYGLSLKVAAGQALPWGLGTQCPQFGPWPGVPVQPPGLRG